MTRKTAKAWIARNQKRDPMDRYLSALDMMRVTDEDVHEARGHAHDEGRYALTLIEAEADAASAALN